MSNIAMLRLAVHRPAIDPFAIFIQLNDMRNALAPLAGGHTLCEIVAVKTCMGIGTDKFVFNLHMFSLSDCSLSEPHDRRSNDRSVLLPIVAPSSGIFKTGSGSAAPDGKRPAD